MAGTRTRDTRTLPERGPLSRPGSPSADPAVRTGLEASEGGIGGARGHAAEVRAKGNRAIRRQQTSSVKGCRELSQTL